MRKLLISLVFLSCAIIRREERLNIIVPEESFKEGKRLFELGKYRDAIKRFKEVLYVKSFGDLADSAQIYLCESHLRLRDYDQAITEFLVFIQNYPKNDSLKARAYIGITKAYLGKYGNVNLDISELDQASIYAQKAYEMGIYRDSAESMMKKIRHRKASKMLIQADVYYKLKLLEAWKVYLQEFLNLFPDDPKADSIRKILK